MQRKIPFANGEYYHIFNRGVDKREVFSDKDDYLRFLTSIKEFNREEAVTSLYHLERCRQAPKPPGGYLSSHPVASVICYCLNPNHYHLILRQEKDRGISRFMHKLAMGYTHYFNKKHSRSGSLFQGPFKSAHIDSNEYLLHLSVYVNANNFIHGHSKIEQWPYCSYLDYIGKRNGKLCQKNVILNQFKDQKEYESFCRDNMLYLKDKKESECYTLE